MKKYIFSLISLFFCVACHGQSENICVQSPVGICVVPVDAIFFARHDLFGKKISVQGVASVESDGVFFYPDVESKKYLIRERAVLVIGDDNQLGDIRFQDGKRLTFVGILIEEKGRYWAAIRLTNVPLEEPLPSRGLPPAPPPPQASQGTE